MLKNLLAKLGLRKHADEESYGAETTSKETQRVQEGVDRRTPTPPTGDAPPATQPGEPPTRSES